MPRRLIGMVIDFGIFSYCMHIGDEAMAPLYPIYLWVIFGNGFRFGLTYLAAASACGVLSFMAVVLTTDFWHRHLAVVRRPHRRPGAAAALCVEPDPQAVGRQAPGGGGEPRQEPVPRQRQPRTAHAAQCRHRPERSDARHPARRRADGHGADDRPVRPYAAQADQLDPRFLPHRSRPHAAKVRTLRPARRARVRSGEKKLRTTPMPNTTSVSSISTLGVS